MIHISPNKCIGCGICQKACPEGIEIKNGKAEIKNQNAHCLKIAIQVCPQHAIRDIREKIVFAIGTDDGKNIKLDDHVGMSKYFSIWEYSAGEIYFKEQRKNVKYKEKIHGDPEKAKKVSGVLDGVNAIVGGMFGPNIISIRKKFLPIVIRTSHIKNALEIIKRNINEITESLEKKEKNAIVLK